MFACLLLLFVCFCCFLLFYIIVYKRKCTAMTCILPKTLISRDHMLYSYKVQGFEIDFCNKSVWLKVCDHQAENKYFHKLPHSLPYQAIHTLEQLKRHVYVAILCNVVRTMVRLSMLELLSKEMSADYIRVSVFPILNSFIQHATFVCCVNIQNTFYAPAMRNALRVAHVRPCVRACMRACVLLCVRPSFKWVLCERNSSYNFIPILLNFYRCFCQGLKMCMTFG